MLRAVFIVNLALCLGIVTGGCGKSKIRQYDSQACSINDSDDPLLVCSPAYDLICISTDSIRVRDAEEAKKWDGGVRPIYVCRLACNNDTECFQGGDICCTGDIHGKTYGKKGGCTPPGMCAAIRGTGDTDAGLSPPPDAGGDDAPAVDASPPDTARDSAPDAASDSGDGGATDAPGDGSAG
jgi:hypothetical protein